MLEPFFLESAGGPIFCVLFRARCPRVGSPVLLFLPPWAEEANKSRRMMARLGHSLAEEAGVSMLIPDFYGTGDSAGEFIQADWETWLANVVDAAHWLRDRDWEQFFVGGLRSGALLAMGALPRLPKEPERWILWQPVISGRHLLQQFLRLRVAASIGMGTAKETTKSLRGRLEQGETVEIAGYELNPGLAASLEQQELATLVPPIGSTGAWLEVAHSSDQGVLPAAQKVLDTWWRAGVRVAHRAVVGDAFWATQELVDVPALVSESVAWLKGEAS